MKVETQAADPGSAVRKEVSYLHRSLKLARGEEEGFGCDCNVASSSRASTADAVFDSCRCAAAAGGLRGNERRRRGCRLDLPTPGFINIESLSLCITVESRHGAVSPPASASLHRQKKHFSVFSRANAHVR